MACPRMMSSLTSLILVVTIVGTAGTKGWDVPPDPYGDPDNSHGSHELDHSEKLLELSVDGHIFGMDHLNAAFNWNTFDKFLQCLCGVDNDRCDVVINGDAVEKVIANEGPITTMATNKYICSAMDGTSIRCKRADDDGKRAFTVEGDHCPLQKVDVYWVKHQRLDVIVRKGYSSSMLRCIDRCRYVDGRDGHGISKVLKAVIISVVCLIATCALVITVCLVKRLKRKSKVRVQEKVKPIEPDNPEKIAKNDMKYSPTSVLPPYSYFDSSNHYDGNNLEKGSALSQHDLFNTEGGGTTFENAGELPLLQWPRDTRLMAPPYESAPPPYYTICKPLTTINEEMILTQTPSAAQVNLPEKETSVEMRSEPRLKRDKRRALVNISS
uniref:Uncharacterized protein n=1 Tax=Biomphalaria glabrata TaxID=6526 RepID=A0A2C9KKD4_BIOGL